MKKLLSLVFISSVLVSLTGCGAKYDEKLYILNWGEYMDQDLIKDFEKEFKIDVIYNEVDSNEAMYSKIKAGGTKYDLAIPSDYMVEKMISENLLLEIDRNAITNFNHIDPMFLNIPFDQDNKFSIPYFWGTIGIMYNKNLVDEEDLTGWDVLWNPKYKKQVYMYDSVRDAFATALMKLGYSINETDPIKVKEASKELINIDKNIAGYGTDDIKNLIMSEEAAMGVVYNGDFLDSYFEMEDEEDMPIGYYIPSTGTNLWFDNMVIPKTAQNKSAAEKFINFMTDPKNALQNTEYVGYPTTNKTAYQDLLNDEEYVEYGKLQAYFPEKSIIEKSEVYVDLKDSTKMYDSLWTEIKSK